MGGGEGACSRPPPAPPQLLFQESNPGVRYEYTIHREADGPGLGPPPEFSWLHGPWSKCTVTCGTGGGPEPLARDAGSASSSPLIHGATMSLEFPHL